jgi:hypothetical protein
LTSTTSSAGRSPNPAIASAAEDALRPLGVVIDSLPLTPKHVRTLIREAQGLRPGAD